VATQITDVVKHFIQEQGISEERALHLVEDTLLQAYKRQYGNADNAVIRFGDDNEEVSILAKKTVVDGVYDPITEIDLEEARSYNPEAELGDDLLLEVDPKEFDRISVQSANQTARQSIRGTKKDTH
jgi:N utilization substance protein A